MIDIHRTCTHVYTDHKWPKASSKCMSLAHYALQIHTAGYQSKRTPSRDGTPEAATSEQNGRPTTGHKSPDHKSQSSYPKTGSPPNSNTSPGSEKHKVFGKTLDTHDAGYSSAPDEPTTPTPIGIPLSEMSSGASPHTPAVHTVGHVATNDSHIQPCLVLPTTSGHSLERLRRQRKIDVQASHEDDDVIRIRRRRQSEKVESVDKEKEKLLSSLVKVQDKYIKLLEQGHQAHKQKTTWCNCPSTCCNHVVAIVMLIFLLVVLLFAGIWCTVSVLRH